MCVCGRSCEKQRPSASHQKRECYSTPSIPWCYRYFTPLRPSVAHLDPRLSLASYGCMSQPPTKKLKTTTMAGMAETEPERDSKICMILVPLCTASNDYLYTLYTCLFLLAEKFRASDFTFNKFLRQFGNAIFHPGRLGVKLRVNHPSIGNPTDPQPHSVLSLGPQCVSCIRAREESPVNDLLTAIDWERCRKTSYIAQQVVLCLLYSTFAFIYPYYP